MSFPILWVIHFLQSQKAFHHECVDALHIESFPKISIVIFFPPFSSPSHSKSFNLLNINNMHNFLYINLFINLIPPTDF